MKKRIYQRNTTTVLIMYLLLSFFCANHIFGGLRDPFSFDTTRYPQHMYRLIGIAQINHNGKAFALIKAWNRNHYISIGDSIGLLTVTAITPRSVTLQDKEKKRLYTLHLTEQGKHLAINSA